MNKNTKITVVAILGIIILGFVFFILTNNQNSGQKSTKSSDKLQVVASFYPLAFFSEQIGGDKVQVTNIVPAGAEPHDYEPTAQDMVKMEDSRLIILNGGGLETWSNNIQKNINLKKTIIIVAGEGLTTPIIGTDGEGLTTQSMGTAGEELITQSPEKEGKIGIDPHIWLDPPLAKKMVNRIVQGFIQADPVNKDYYNFNAQALETKLDVLDLAYQQALSNCQEKNIITSHTAFAYLADRYGLNQVSIAGLSPDAEPSPQQLIDIVKFAKNNKVKYIFFEGLVSPKLAQTIANEVGAQTLVLDPLEGLSKEALAQGENYLTVMQKNLINLTIALQCPK